MYKGSLHGLLGRRVLVEVKPGVTKEGIARYTRTAGDEVVLIVDFDGRDGIGTVVDPEHIIGPLHPIRGPHRL